MKGINWIPRHKGMRQKDMRQKDMRQKDMRHKDMVHKGTLFFTLKLELNDILSTCRYISDVFVHNVLFTYYVITYIRAGVIVAKKTTAAMYVHIRMWPFLFKERVGMS